jgi:hypothetical protein
LTAITYPKTYIGWVIFQDLNLPIGDLWGGWSVGCGGF